MTARPYWTPADDAELAVLVDELVRGYFDHRAWCHATPCPHLGAASDAVLEWRRARSLRSRAAYLRALQDFTDRTTEAPTRRRKEAAA